jgi:hypothetical protein
MNLGHLYDGIASCALAAANFANSVLRHSGSLVQIENDRVRGQACQPLQGEHLKIGRLVRYGEVSRFDR